MSNVSPYHLFCLCFDGRHEVDVLLPSDNVHQQFIPCATLCVCVFVSLRGTSSARDPQRMIYIIYVGERDTHKSKCKCYDPENVEDGHGSI